MTKGALRVASVSELARLCLMHSVVYARAYSRRRKPRVVVEYCHPAQPARRVEVVWFSPYSVDANSGRLFDAEDLPPTWQKALVRARRVAKSLRDEIACLALAAGVEP